MRDHQYHPRTFYVNNLINLFKTHILIILAIYDPTNVNQLHFYVTDISLMGFV